MPDGPQALESAREAAELDALASEGRARSLQVLLQVACQADEPSAAGRADSLELVRQSALELMEHPTAPLPLRLAACASVAAAPWLVALAPEMLRALSLRARQCPTERLHVLVAHLRLSSSSARSSPESVPAAAALVAVLEEVKAFGDCAEEDRAKLQAAAWESSVRVANAALAVGLAQKAREWASWAVHFCEGDAGRLADARLLVALCHLSGGLREEARAAAEAALAGCPGHAPALELLLADAARRGDRAAARALLAERPRASGSLAARAGALVRALRDEVPAGQPQAAARSPARVLRSRLQLAVALQMPASEVTELLSAFTTLLEYMQVGASFDKGGSATEEAAAGAGAAQCAAKDEAREVVRLTYAYAEACRRDGAWSSCGEVLEALLLLQRGLGAAPHEQARCLVHLADSLICGLADEESSSDLPGGPAERVGALVQEARQLLSPGDHCGPGQPPDWGRLRELAWLLEMKLCCHLGADATATFMRELRLAAEGPQGPVAEPPPPLLLLAQAAPRATPLGADVAGFCLRALLAAPPAPPAEARAGTAAVCRAALCRQLVDLLPQQEAQLEAVRDLFLQWHLEGSGQRVPAGSFGPGSEKEAWWLLAFSLDSASRLWLCGDHGQSKAWADVGVGLLQACTKAGCLPSSHPFGGPATTHADGAAEA